MSGVFWCFLWKGLASLAIKYCIRFSPKAANVSSPDTRQTIHLPRTSRTSNTNNRNKNQKCDRLLALFVTSFSHVHDPRVVDEIEAPPPLFPCNVGEWAGARRAGDNAEGGQRASAGRG